MIEIPKFKNSALFKQAFIHRSYLNETKEDLTSNERLEFLGDSIISFIVSDYLFQKFKNFNEGILTNLRSLLVNTKSLAALARSLNFGDLLMVSKGEEESKGRQNQSLLANSFEAFIGALFLDQGLDKVKEFLEEVLLPQADFYVKNKIFKDPKSLLQERVQSQKRGSLIYKVIDEAGPAHAKIFTVGVFINDLSFGEGKGKSKQEAEENAAQQALERL
jgi:ribonuclease-3